MSRPEGINYMIIDKGRFLTFLPLFAAFLCISLFSLNCADDPTSLGLKFLPKEDTTGIRVFDSSIDTMQITSTNKRIYVNTYFSGNLVVGMKGNYISKALIKFTNISANYDSAVVNSAVLKLKYNNYSFPPADSSNPASFDIFTIEQKLNFQTITMDSVSTSTFGNVSKGNFSGTLADTHRISINFDTTLVRHWLEYAADTNHAVKNYGIVLSPTVSSNVLKSFYSGRTDAAVRPVLEVIVTKNNDRDTLILDNSETLFLATTTFAPDPERFFLQAGVSFTQAMRFDLSKIPPTATINDVLVYLTIDSAFSVFSSQTEKKIAASRITDTSGMKTEGAFIGEPTSSNLSQYVFRIIPPFQRWLNGETNYGILIMPFNQRVNFDLFAFYDITASDPAKRPRVVIKYTPRVHP
jgi:hypothetical protein